MENVRRAILIAIGFGVLDVVGGGFLKLGGAPRDPLTRSDNPESFHGAF